MFKHLRAQGRSIERAMKDVEKFTQRYDENANFEGGKALLMREGIWLQICPDRENNILAIKAYTNYIPNLEAPTLRDLYYSLLDLSDNPETGLAYFCIMDGDEVGMAQDVIGVEVKRPLADMSWEEFEAGVDAVEEVAALHAPRIAKEYDLPRIG